MPRMTIIAGCNGAGKTTVAKNAFSHDTETLWINPDHTTDDLLRLYPDLVPNRNAANLLAATVTEGRVDHAIEAGRTFAVETVLSSTKYLSRVHASRARGFSVGLVYVILESAELATQRVSDRTKNGGHGVDPKAIRKRWMLSQFNLIRFIPLVDDLIIFDNSNKDLDVHPILFAEKRDDMLHILDWTVLPFLRDLLTTVAASGEAGFQLAAF